MDTDDFELKRALDAYFRTQYENDERMIAHMVAIDKQLRALLAIFGAAAKEVGSKR